MKTILILLGLVAATTAQFRNRGNQVHDRLGNKEYHFSWRNTRDKWTWGQANSYCSRLGGGWRGISITDRSIDGFVSRVLQGERMEYIWTSGQRSGRGWAWGSGPFSPLNWSHTGGARRPQPDNREGNESCLAVLNNFYNDGVKWHDVACHHLKPIICERG